MAALYLPAVVPKAANNSPLSDAHVNDCFQFQPEQRLLCSSDFQAVFDQTVFKVGETSFLLLVRPNGLDHARLGLVIAKRKVRRSVDRNRLKRVVRESFRLYQKQLPQVDIIFMARQDVAVIASPDFRIALVNAWKRLCRWAEKQLASAI